MELPVGKKQPEPPGVQPTRPGWTYPGLGAVRTRGFPAMYCCANAVIAGRALPMSGKFAEPDFPQTPTALALPGRLIGPFTVCKGAGAPAAVQAGKNCR